MSRAQQPVVYSDLFWLFMPGSLDIYFTAVGMLDIPAEKEIQAMIEEIRKNPQDFKFVA